MKTKNRRRRSFEHVDLPYLLDDDNYYTTFCYVCLFFFFLFSFSTKPFVVCIHFPLRSVDLDPCLSFVFVFFFFFGACVLKRTKFVVHVLFNTDHALFMGPTVTLFKKNIKNGFHGTIHTFKNYFATAFSVFSFQFLISAKISCIQTDRSVVF